MVGDNLEQELTIVNLSQSVPSVPEKNHPRETSRVAQLLQSAGAGCAFYMSMPPMPPMPG